MTFVKPKETDLAAQMDVSITKSIEENPRSGNVRPLFRLQATMDEANRPDAFFESHRVAVRRVPQLVQWTTKPLWLLISRSFRLELRHHIVRFTVTLEFHAWNRNESFLVRYSAR